MSDDSKGKAEVGPGLEEISYDQRPEDSSMCCRELCESTRGANLTGNLEEAQDI